MGLEELENDIQDIYHILDDILPVIEDFKRSVKIEKGICPKCNGYMRRMDELFLAKSDSDPYRIVEKERFKIAEAGTSGHNLIPYFCEKCRFIEWYCEYY